MLRRILLTAAAATLAMLITTQSALAVEEPAPPFPATVVDVTVNVRAAPNTDSNLYGILHRGDEIWVVDVVAGEAPDWGSGVWYQLASGGYLYSRYAAPTVAGYGHWIDVDLTNLTATAMVWNEAVYTADIVAGRPGWDTPTGTFNIMRRIENETMDAGTLGIPPTSPEYHYFPNVLYTQYFDEYGTALHYNYWGSEEDFGQRNTSKGCVGLSLNDALYFWNFAELGTVVRIHY